LGACRVVFDRDAAPGPEPEDCGDLTSRQNIGRSGRCRMMNGKTAMATLAARDRRILTTHAGSLPRRASLSALLFARMSKKPFDAGALARETSGAVAETVRKQREVGIDIVSDGEQSKTSFQHYISDRLSGLESIIPKAGERRTRENMAFPAFYKGGVHSGSAQARFACTGPIKYTGHQQLAQDLSNLKLALGEQNPVDAFVPSVSPSSCAGRRNGFG